MDVLNSLNFFLIICDFLFFIIHIFFLFTEKLSSGFLLRPLSEGCPATHFKYFSVRSSYLSTFLEVIHKKLGKLEIFRLISSQFTNHYIPSLDFFSTVTHLNFLPCDVIVSFLSHLPSNLEFIFLF